MWKEKLKDIIKEKAIYGEKINNGALEKEISILMAYSSLIRYGTRTNGRNNISFLVCK